MTARRGELRREAQCLKTLGPADIDAQCIRASMRLGTPAIIPARGRFALNVVSLPGIARRTGAGTTMGSLCVMNVPPSTRRKGAADE